MDDFSSFIEIKSLTSKQSKVRISKRTVSFISVKGTCLVGARYQYLTKFGFLRLVFPENMNTESIPGSELMITMLTLVDHGDMPGLHMTPHNMFGYVFIRLVQEI